MKVVWSLRALLHLGQIRRYIARDNPDVAWRVADEIVRVSSLLSDHPYLGRPRRGGLRDLGIGRYPYILRYRVTEDAVEIASVWHDRQKRPP